jgi:type II secretory pathway pseudopilin PulG
MSTALKRRNRPRRGVTLVEMLVVVALVVLMMVILVQIFQSALGAMSASRTTQELDVVLRSIDSMIRSDLNGVTARMTPGTNYPINKPGYFEYGENAPADLQGEDTDDFLAFTTKAPEGQVFTGRQWLSTPNPSQTNPQKINQAVQPATISSEVAEVIYFLRNGNLYRRVFLVAPERKTSITTNAPFLGLGKYPTSMFGKTLSASWLGMNDISCRPGGYGGPGNPLPPIPNDLGDLTNRENRAFRPRFLNDFTGVPGSPNVGVPDGIPDDSNSDAVNDYYPTLYYDGVGYSPDGTTYNWAPNSFVNENVGLLPFNSNQAALQRIEKGTGNSWDVYAFPFIYPGMYSVPDPKRVGNALGWVHYLPPNSSTFYLNHSPLDLGETPGFAPSGTQTWWGFPTWRETMAGSTFNNLISSPGGSGWTDPVIYLTNIGHVQPPGLRPFNPQVTPSLTSPTFLPPVTNYNANGIPFGFDGAGSPVASTNFIANPSAPNTVWQDDLILTNVRSFDVKAYDPDAPLYNPNVGTFLSVGYWDLGYAGLSPATYAPNYNPNSTIYGPNGTNGQNGTGQFATLFQAVNGEPKGFGHEGRIPPYPGDFRLDPRRPFLQNLATGQAVPNNIGDPNPGVIRLTHTFDTWSTDYINAPDTDIVLSQYPGNVLPQKFAPITSRCVYPAFPPPYPSPLRGIQIQIRVTDSRNERTKVLTIRHDFSDKL